MEKFKLISETNSYVAYAYKTDYDEFTVNFDKEIKTVDIRQSHFVLKDATLEPQWKDETDKWLKHSCKYGHWQSETLICLSADDIEFISHKCKELFGKEQR